MPEPLVYADLLDGAPGGRCFAPFNPGIEICVLQEGSPQVALLRYEPGARAPLHRHTGLETILVLEGSQTDENGHYPVGSFVLNPTGSAHSVWSDEGCLVLIQWARPVVFLDAD